VHTMEELKLTGNHLAGSRPIVSFDGAMDAGGGAGGEGEEGPQWAPRKELLGRIFAVPVGHRKAKPFFDHVTSFSVCDGRLWLRNYQATEDTALSPGTSGDAKLALVEAGPRMTLQLIKAFEGCFKGKVIYDNETYVGPNALRAEAKAEFADRYNKKMKSVRRREEHQRAALQGAFDDPLHDMFRGDDEDYEDLDELRGRSKYPNSRVAMPGKRRGGRGR